MALLTNLPPSLAEALAHPPERGQRNVWLFTIAVRARHVASPARIRKFLTTIAAQWHDRDFAPEIERAISRAFSSADHSTSAICDQKSQIPPWPPFSPIAWQRRLGTPPKFGLEPLGISAEAAIDALFGTTKQSAPRIDASGLLVRADPLLCLAIDTRSAHTQPRESWRGLEAGLQFMVANPMIAPTGRTQSGVVSPRCHENATRHRLYQVVEFDRGTLAEQAAILSSLDSDAAPLVLVVWSGGKSLHGWFRVGSLPEQAQLRFFRHAVHLGADASLWDPAKLVRLPGGRRSTGENQSVLFLNPPGRFDSRTPTP
jgi:hypothetical protein